MIKMTVENVIYPQSWCYLASFFAVLFCVFGVSGNLLTIVALLKSERLRKHATTAFLLSLTFSDLLFCTIMMPMQAVRYYYRSWTFGDFLCQVFPFVFYSNDVIDDPYDYQPIHSHHVSTFISKDLSNKIHISSAVLSLFFPLAGLWGEMGYDTQTFSCTILKKNGKSPKTFIFLVGFLLPCFIIILSYSCIFNTVRKQHAKLNKFDSNQANKSKLKFFRNKNDLRLTVMMLVIFLAFIMCFLPLMVVNVFDDKTKYPFAHVMASVSAWSSAVINPIIYAVGSSQYRNAYKNLFIQIKTWKSFNSSGNNNNKAHVSRSNTVEPISNIAQKSPGEGVKPDSSCLEDG
ncbi:CLUMA_CG014912, isoform A [Clunio marinus]|uniref:CLUMA_CG014912, isoform A n=1 Tax=Clunio marinus TaxID=568069 RepID=A0A1J1ING5_9DIPT|nr:CLUMA_CG014912, isoform A [Clunio marinus]